MNARFLGMTLVGIMLAIFVTGGSSSVKAQIGGGGAIEGTITDPGGSIVPGATVTVTNVATGVETSRQTNEAGVYVIPGLSPGEYKVVVTLKGFQTLIQEKVIVDALSKVTVNLALKVGEVTETVTVSEAPSQLNTSDASTGNNDPKRVVHEPATRNGNGCSWIRNRSRPKKSRRFHLSCCPESLKEIVGDRLMEPRAFQKMCSSKEFQSPIRFSKVKVARLLLVFRSKRSNSSRWKRAARESSLMGRAPKTIRSNRAPASFTVQALSI